MEPTETGKRRVMRLMAMVSSTMGVIFSPMGGCNLERISHLYKNTCNGSCLASIDFGRA